MANLKEVRNRIKSVSSTQQITKAMKMVSAAKLRRAQDAVLQMRPYAQKLSEIMANVSADSAIDLSANPYSEERVVEKVLIICITSDRGLCGAFNGNVVKAVNALIREKYSSQMEKGHVQVLTMGKKGNDVFLKSKVGLLSDYSHIFQQLSFDEARKAAERAMSGFVHKEFDKVEIVYNEFKNVATQIVRTVQFLPIVKEETTSVKASNVDYIYEPSKEQIVSELIPKSLKVRLFSALLESNASEHGARMTAMDKATENAGELLKDLKLTYNRSRQAAITKEILEIVGGAEALASA
jgi:F-type H+-transporting ATPase subunit gamma